MIKSGTRKMYISSGKTKEKSWIVTFNDILTIVFTFFALILAFSVPHQDFLSKAADSFRRTWGDGLAEVHKVFPDAIDAIRDRDIEREKAKQQKKMEATLHALRSDFLSVVRDFPYLSLTMDQSVLNINLPRTLIFPGGTTFINERSQESLRRIAQTVSRHEVYVRIEIPGEVHPQQKSRLDIAWHEIAGQLAALADFFSCEHIQPQRITLASPKNGSQRTPESDQVVLLISPTRL